MDSSPAAVILAHKPSLTGYLLYQAYLGTASNIIPERLGTTLGRNCRDTGVKASAGSCASAYYYSCYCTTILSSRGKKPNRGCETGDRRADVPLKGYDTGRAESLSTYYYLERL